MTRSSSRIEAEISSLERQLFALKDQACELSDAAAALSASAAVERARNASMGRGIGGALLGAKYRAAARRSAASGNAAIARDVAHKKAQLTQAKLDLRLREREMRAHLRELKAELKEARERDRQGVPTRPFIPAARPAPAPPPPLSGDRLKEELRRLKALHSQGAIDGAAYENARIALLQPHLRS